MSSYALLPSPLGEIVVAGSGGAVDALYFPTHSRYAEARKGRRDDGLFAVVLTQLREYFAGHRRDFDLALAARGTPFQERVWQGLRAIPFGAVRSYRDLATAVGKPAAFRAVGLANGRNPVSLIVPCHRVIGADGSLTGYGGGLEAKRWLLDHERALM